MRVTYSPNVRRDIAGDPMYAIAVAAMQQDRTRDGYLNLYREGRMFYAVCTRGGETQRASSTDLISAIMAAVERADAA